MLNIERESLPLRLFAAVVLVVLGIGVVGAVYKTKIVFGLYGSSVKWVGG